MIDRTFAALLTSLVLTAGVHADGAMPPQTDGSRFSFHQVADGFLRLDNETGKVALCSRQPVGWACLAAPDDRTALENEIVRLRRDNAILKEDLLSRGLPLPAGTMPVPSAGEDENSFTLRLPNSEDVNRVVAFVGQVWHRLLAALARADSQLMHRG